MSAYQIALLLHIAGAIAYFAGVAVAGLAFAAAARSPRPSEIVAVLGLARSGVLVTLAGTAMLLGCAFWLIELSGSIDMGDGWVSAALALFVLAAVVGGIAGQAPKKARKLAAALADGDDRRTPELDRLLADRPSLVLNVVAALAAIAVLVLMVWQPGG
ncbi:MAG: DUF2269 family protein [Gaiellales bacterium]